MNSNLSYISIVFRVSVGLVITSLISLFSVFWYFDPFKENWYIWAVLVLIFTLAASVLMLGYYAWNWINRKEIIFNQTLNSFALTSTAFASISVLLILLWQTNNLNLVSLILTFVAAF
jgi:hypothetical protein